MGHFTSADLKANSYDGYALRLIIPHTVIAASLYEYLLKTPKILKLVCTI